MSSISSFENMAPRKFRSVTEVGPITFLSC